MRQRCIPLLLERGVVRKPLLSERDVVGIMLSERDVVGIMLSERDVVGIMLSERDVVGIMLSETGLVTKLLLSDWGGVVYIVSEGCGV